MKHTWAHIVIAATLILFACTNLSTTPESQASNNSNHWEALWLNTPLCEPPCWENITPGKTNYAEALSILEKLPGVIITYNDQQMGISWIFDKNRPDSGLIRFNPDGTVYSIWLGNSYDQKLYLKTVVDSFAYPTYIQPYDCREGMCSTALAYPDRGMVLEVFLEDMGKINAHQVAIDASSEVNFVYFIETGLESYLSTSMYQEYQLLFMKWKGYGEYP